MCPEISTQHFNRVGILHPKIGQKVSINMGRKMHYKGPGSPSGKNPEDCFQYLRNS